MVTPPRLFSLQQAFRAHPELARVVDRIRQSEQMLALISPLLQPGLRAQIQAGPVDEESWCLLVGNPAVGTKLRQLTPALLAALRNGGFAVPRLRIKIRVR
ncbi:hypothetical protein [Malikia sp.]|uniref:hypothetical protein n=1 Tax=Malikia sp. TaxID=2070706 RepID=UPI00262C39AD|nr:hypothetical protein [Malikia sp.]MDD2730022.1 hypothetical protein [Malikia sp.]